MTFPTKTFLIFCSLFAIAASAILVTHNRQTPAQTATLIDSVSEKSALPDRDIKMIFVGDLMFDRGIKKKVDEKARGDYLFLFQYIKDILADADITFGNLEGPIAESGVLSGSKYSFRMHPDVARVLNFVGFDVVSFANNHAGDYGREAFLETFQHLGRAGIQLVGAGANTATAENPTVFLAGNTRIGFIGFSDVGPNWLESKEDGAGILLAKSPEFVSEVVRQARGKVDILIVSFHFGDEYKTKSNLRQQALAHAAIDAGAVFVVGHHPHVVEEIEKYNGGVIAYSLGNFIFDQAFSPETKKSLILEVTIRGKALKEVKPIPIKFNQFFQPMIMTEPTKNI